MAYQEILYAKNDGVGFLTLNNPRKMREVE